MEDFVMKKVYRLNGSVVYITKQLENFYVNNFDAYELANKLLEDTDNNIDKVKTILKRMRFALYVKEDDIDKFLKLFNYDIKTIENEDNEDNKEVYIATNLTPSVLSYLDEFDKNEILVDNGTLIIKEMENEDRDNIILKIIAELFG